MDKETELKMLFEANAMLNSPEAQAAREQLAAFQRLCDNDMKAMEIGELNKLAKVQAEVNAELRLFQEMQAEYQPIEPVSAELPRNYDLENIADELKDLTQDVSQYHAEYNENRRADAIKAEKEKKHSFRHDFFCSGVHRRFDPLFRAHP